MKAMNTAIKSFVLMLIGGLNLVAAAGLYAPAAGQDGSTAISKDDDSFVAWADGWCNYIIGIEVDAQWQTPEKALGKAEGDSFDIVSLGRGGQIALTFSIPIADGPGWDFATFENSVTDTFLELGYVEVSSDGINFFRFDNYSQTAALVGPFGMVDPTDITGYCSKYRQGYGTPFDLEELKGVSVLLDISLITHVRIIDIVEYAEPADFNGDKSVNFIDFGLFAVAYGSEVGDDNWNENCDISNFADGKIDLDDLQMFVKKWLNDCSNCDSNDNPIYDPYPTTGSAGVDLDAIGVIHQKTLQADISGDGIVNLEDYVAFSAAYLSDPISPRWNYKCDLEPFIDDYINMDDILVLTEQWLLTEQWYDR